MLAKQCFHFLKRDAKRVPVRLFGSWDHSKYISYDPVDVKEGIDELQKWVKIPDHQQSIIHFTRWNPRPLIDARDILSYIDGRSSNEVELPKQAKRTLSALLTFPLTLSYGLSYLYAYKRRPESFNILIIGARSESSLPSCWWRELLARSTKGDTENFDIRMIGPGLQYNKSFTDNKYSTLQYQKSTDDARSERSVNIVSKFMSRAASTNSADKRGDGVNGGSHDVYTLHEHPESLSLLQWADIFLLYNPGYGNEVLKESWDPTIRYLLQTRKPILCTAYGSHDLRRDLSALDAITAEEDDQELGEPLEFLIPPHENPFKSLKYTMDAREEGDDGIVYGNHSIYAFAAK